MSFLKDLSTRYYKDAKQLNYTWMDLIKKTTREKVIDDVRLVTNIKIMNKAEEDTIKSKIRDKILKEMEDKVKREHVKIMKQQKTKTEIKQVAKALKGYTKSFKIGIKNNKDPLKQLQITRKAIKHHIASILTSMKGLKFVETLRITSKRMSNGKIVYDTAYFNSKPQTIINNKHRNP